MSSRKRGLPRGWYPVDRNDCKREIESYIEGWSLPKIPFEERRGGIVPHAGWYFSGRLAARVLSCLRSKEKIDLAVIYGGHLGPNDHPRIVLEEVWETPFGDIEIDMKIVKRIMKEIQFKEESPHSGDNTIEIQLAMVKYFFPDTKILAIRSPASSKAIVIGREVANIIKEEGISAVAIGSTDLTHYGPNYGFLKKGVGPSSVEWVKKENDKGFIDHALRMDMEGLLRHAEENYSACSAGAAVSAIATCYILGSEKGFLIDYYTSYDILPDQSFVGYAGIIY